MGEQLYFQITDRGAMPLLEKLHVESIPQLKELDPSIYDMMRSLLNYKTLWGMVHCPYSLEIFYFVYDIWVCLCV